MKATFISLMALGVAAAMAGPADRALADEPMVLTDGQLDQVTAGQHTSSKGFGFIEMSNGTDDGKVELQVASQHPAEPVAGRVGPTSDVLYSAAGNSAFVDVLPVPGLERR